MRLSTLFYESSRTSRSISSSSFFTKRPFTRMRDIAKCFRTSYLCTESQGHLYIIKKTKDMYLHAWMYCVHTGSCAQHVHLRCVLSCSKGSSFCAFQQWRKCCLLQSHALLHRPVQLNLARFDQHTHEQFQQLCAVGELRESAPTKITFSNDEDDIT